MKNPQTYAEEIGKHAEIIGKNGCCAFVSMWIAGIEPDEEAEAIATLSRAIDAGVIQEDCTVLWKPFFKFLTGREISVEFRSITSLDEIKNVPGRIAVKYKWRQSHWVGVENGKVKFNPLRVSKTVTYGKPEECRIITFKKI